MRDSNAGRPAGIQPSDLTEPAGATEGMTSSAAAISPEPDDVARAALGDSAAFERLYRAHVGRVTALARWLLGGDEVEDAVQDAFIRAWQKLGTFSGEAAFGTWLHRVAVNVVLTRRAALGTRRDRFLADDAVLESLPSPAAPSVGGLGLDLERMLPLLPEGARQIFVLHDVEGYRHEEIADLMGVTTGTTKSQLHRARMLLRQRLEG